MHYLLASLAAPIPDGAGMLEVVSHSLRLGFGHILPHGLDHVLFVLGLFLFCRELYPLLWQITLFTLAHSLTLGLSVYGMVSLPSHPVEVLIALSIALIALENLSRKGFSRWRPAIIFGCGLVHGLGFANGFREISPGEEQFPLALLSFNIGIELGQMVVAILAFVCLSAFWHRPWYRKAVVIPLSGLMTVTSLFWVVTRGFPS